MGRKLKWSENTYFQIMHYSIQMFPTISLHFFNMNPPRNSKTYRECCDGCWTCREDNKHSSKLWYTLINRYSFWYIQNKKKIQRLIQETRQLVFTSKMCEKYLWISERCCTFIYCVISTPFQRHLLKLYKDHWTKMYLTSALSWSPFHITSVDYFYEERCPCVSIKRFDQPDL